MSFSVLIPARYDSVRLPGKPLVDLSGKTIVRRVYEAATKSDANLVCVATDSEAILKECDSFGAKCVLTNKSHKTGSDRLAQATSILGLDNEHVVVNLQGDEPFVNFRDINTVATILDDENIDMGTLYADLDAKNESNPNVVKVWSEAGGKVISFSRNELKITDSQLLKSHHIGIYAYRVGFLNEFIDWPQTDNEKVESLEQLRALDRGKIIHAKKSISEIHLGIDTIEDLNLAKKILLDA